ncbi:molecular chaperone [Providencia rettgeri]
MKKHLISLALLFMTTLNANASVILGGTRVIYEGNKKEASISVRNDDKTPYLADSSPKCNAKPPFLAPQTPPKVV